MSQSSINLIPLFKLSTDQLNFSDEIRMAYPSVMPLLDVTRDNDPSKFKVMKGLAIQMQTFVTDDDIDQEVRIALAEVMDTIQ